MPIKAVIVEDESGARKVLQALITDYLPQIEIVGTADSVESGIALVTKEKPELLFLDIRLPDGDGFEILEKTVVENMEVVFTTAYGEYREKAFEYFAFQYLTKPIDVDKLEATVKAYEARRKDNKTDSSFSLEKLGLLKQLLNQQIKKIALPNKDGYTLVQLEEIIYCEAQSNYTLVYLKDGSKMMVTKSLKYYDELLSDSNFYRVHKSYLVNVNYVKEVKQEGTLKLENGSSLPISQRSKRGFLKFLERMT